MYPAGRRQDTIAGASLLSKLAYDLFDALTLLAPLYLVSRWRIHFAGRLLIPLGALLALYRPTFAGWEPIFYLLSVTVLLVIAFPAGWALDFGASTEPDALRSPNRRWILLVPSLILMPQFVAAYRSLGHPFLVLGFLSAALCCAWGWWPGRRLSRAAALSSPDAETLRIASIRRWALRASGRALAMTLGLLPLFLFLHNLELEQRLRWPSPADGAIRTVTGGEKIWFWKLQGRLLEAEDLRRQEIYGFTRAQVDLETRSKIIELEAKIASPHLGEPLEAKARDYEEMRKVLRPFRIADPAAFQRVLAVEPDPTIYLLEDNPIRAGGPNPSDPRIFFVQEQLWDEDPQLIPLGREEIAARTAHNSSWQWLLLASGALGFVILWRRGGDSSPARWLGLWLVGAGVAATYDYTALFLPALMYRIWHVALASPSGHVLLVGMALVDLATLGVHWLFTHLVPAAALWAHASWPSRGRPDRPRWLDPLVFGAKTAVLAGAMNLAFHGAWWWLGSAGFHLGWGPDRTLALCAAGSCLTLIVCAGLAAGVLRRRASPGANPRITAGTGARLFFLLVQGMILSAVLAADSEGGVAVRQGIEQTGLALGLLFVALLTHRISQGFLHVLSPRDIGAFVAVVIVPGLFAWSEEISQAYLSLVAESAFLQGRGIEILGLLVAIVLISPIRLRLEKGVLYLTHPGLIRIKRLIQRILEEIPERLSSAQAIEEILLSCGFGGYALYVRQGAGTFRLLGHRMEPAPVQTLTLSPALRRVLVQERGFVDLSRVPFEWRFFFVQYELLQVQHAVGGAFLLPIRLGESLRGLLWIPAGLHEEKLTQAPIAEEIEKLGLASFLALEGPQAAPAQKAD